MLFAVVMKVKEGVPPPAERMARRLEWQYPPGVRPIAEYWLLGNDPNVVALAEADSVAPIMVATMAWADWFHITVVPAVTAEEGGKLFKQMSGG